MTRAGTDVDYILDIQRSESVSASGRIQNYVEGGRIHR